MNNNENPIESISETNEDIDNINYIDTIKQLKENTVPKDQYQKLQDENKKLLQSLVNGETMESPALSSTDINKLRKELYIEENDYSNLEYMTKTMELRDAIIAEGRPDPFLPYGKKIMPTEEDIASAERIAKIVKECIEYANGDSTIFTNELNRKMIDTTRGFQRK